MTNTPTTHDHISAALELADTLTNPEAGTVPEKSPNPHNEWIAACREYKLALAEAWELCRQTSKHRDHMEKESKLWLENATKDLRAEINRLTRLRIDHMEVFNKEARAARAAHLALKAQGTPKNLHN